VNLADLGRDLERLPGVLAATVFSDSSKGPRIYLATDVGADREALRSAILAVLQDRHLPADPGRIHIAAPPAGAAAPASPLPRISLDSQDVHRTDGRVECTVRLRAGGRTADGSAMEPDTSTGRARAAARAVLAAMGSLRPDLRLGLHGTRLLDLFGYESVAVLVEAAEGRAHAHLPGSALVERSVEEAGALATLTALRSWGP
jgi:hypothetical protein